MTTKGRTRIIARSVVGVSNDTLRKQATKHTGRWGESWTIDASDLGLKPGEWPRYLIGFDDDPNNPGERGWQGAVVMERAGVIGHRPGSEHGCGCRYEVEAGTLTKGALTLEVLND